MVRGRNELVKELSSRGYYKDQAREIIDEIFGIIAGWLEEQDEVSIRNFGSFKIKTHKGHLIRNAATGEHHEIEDFPVISFKPSDILKASVFEGFKSKKK